MVKASLKEASSIEQLVGSFVDLRKRFGQDVLKRASMLKGPRRTALAGLIRHLKAKGVERLESPIRFEFRGYEKGKPHEIIGVSIASPKLNVLYRYSIACEKKRAGQVEGVGQVSLLGEIPVGKILRKELPVLLPVLGDGRYGEFFSKTGREKREQETARTIKKVEELAFDELCKFGYDVSELENFLKKFFISASLRERGSDINWLARQISSREITDKNLESALSHILENPEYNPEHASLIGRAIIELRQKPTKGLIGGVKDDLYFLDKHPAVHQVDLDRPFERISYYPEKKSIEDGTVREKLKRKVMSFAEALGILRLFPGMLEVRIKFNSSNAMRYFARGDKPDRVQAAVATLEGTVNLVTPLLEEDKKEYNQAKREQRKPDLFLKENFRIAGEVDKIRQLDPSEGDWANLISWTEMQDSKRIFSEFYTLGQQIKLAHDLQGQDGSGIMATSYENIIDFKEKTGLDIGDLVKRIEDIELPKPRTKKEEAVLPVYNEIKGQIGEIKRAAEFGLVKSKISRKLARCHQAVKDYSENSEDLGDKIELLSLFRKICDLTISGIENLAQRRYVGKKDIQKINSYYAAVKRTKALKDIGEEQFGELEQTRNELEQLGNEKYKEMLLYSTYSGSLNPHFTEPGLIVRSRLEGKQMGWTAFMDPREMKERVSELKQCKRGDEYRQDFIDKIKRVIEYASELGHYESYHNLGVGVDSLKKFAQELKKNPGKILVSKGLAEQVGTVYATISQCRKS